MTLTIEEVRKKVHPGVLSSFERDRVNWAIDVVNAEHGPARDARDLDSMARAVETKLREVRP